jgi:hypothetical protein
MTQQLRKPHDLAGTIVGFAILGILGIFVAIPLLIFPGLGAWAEGLLRPAADCLKQDVCIVATAHQWWDWLCAPLDWSWSKPLGIRELIIGGVIYLVIRSTIKDVISAAIVDALNKRGAKAPR